MTMPVAAPSKLPNEPFRRASIPYKQFIRQTLAGAAEGIYERGDSVRRTLVGR